MIIKMQLPWNNTLISSEVLEIILHLFFGSCLIVIVVAIVLALKTIRNAIVEKQKLVIAGVVCFLIPFLLSLVVSNPLNMANSESAELTLIGEYFQDRYEISRADLRPILPSVIYSSLPFSYSSFSTLSANITGALSLGLLGLSGYLLCISVGFGIVSSSVASFIITENPMTLSLASGPSGLILYLSFILLVCYFMVSGITSRLNSNNCKLLFFCMILALFSRFEAFILLAMVPGLCFFYRSRLGLRSSDWFWLIILFILSIPVLWLLGLQVFYIGGVSDSRTLYNFSLDNTYGNIEHLFDVIIYALGFVFALISIFGFILLLYRKMKFAIVILSVSVLLLLPYLFFWNSDFERYAIIALPLLAIGFANTIDRIIRFKIPSEQKLPWVAKYTGIAILFTLASSPVIGWALADISETTDSLVWELYKTKNLDNEPYLV